MAFDINELFGEDGTLTKEQAQQRLQEKGIKLANLASGSYVDAHKYQEAATELENLKRSQMTEAEKMQADLNAIKAQNAMLTKDRTRAKLESLFNKGGVKSDNYQVILDKLAEMDEQQAVTGAQGIVDTLVAQKQALETQIRQEMMQQTPQPKVDGTPVAKKFSEMTMQERVDLKKSNPELYKAESEKYRQKF
jgi:hypothetical protein